MATKTPKRVTIGMLADALGISPSAVSYVLSGQTKKKMAAKTVKLVKETAREMGYVPHQWGRSLRTQKTGIVSIIFESLQMNWADRTMDGIKEVLMPNDFTPIIISYNHTQLLSKSFGQSKRREILSILERRDEGVICQPVPEAKGDYVSLIRNHVPLVFIGSLPENLREFEGVSSVTYDVASAVKATVEHLIQTGRRRIGFVGIQREMNSSRQCYQVFEDTLKESGLPINEKWVIWGDQELSIHPEVVVPVFAGVKEKPDAFFIMNDTLAVMILEMLRNLQIRSPYDVAIVGMGDLPISDIIGLTTIREPLKEIGRKSAEMLLELIRNPEQTPIHRKISCNELKIRRTTSSSA